MTTHSPGPWSVVWPKPWKPTIFAADGFVVADVFKNDNASVIAAAPEMLVALKKMLDHLCSDADLDYPQRLKLTSYLRDLIARAER